MVGTDLAARRSSFTGYADYVEGDAVTGWGFRLEDPASPAALGVFVDGAWVDSLECSLPREDIAQSGLCAGSGGFSYRLPARFRDGAAHRLELRFEDGSRVMFPDRAGGVLPHCEFALAPAVRVEGHVDGVSNGGIQGWVLRTDARTGEKSGGVSVVVTCEGAPVARLVADMFRADVAQAKGCPPGVGFLFKPPPEYRNGRQHRFRFAVEPEDQELANSPYTTSFLGHDAAGKLAALQAEVEDLFTKAWVVSRRLKALMPSGRSTVGEYDAWAREYYPALRAAVEAGRAARPHPGEPPLVSVVCPAYKPRMADFLAAVESVRAQTYQNWELIVVDDASRSPALSACLKELAASDPRIRCLRHARNKGISAATNTALKAARGRYVAFFDHDDALVDVALEVMVDAALATGARLLYSDEDKVDDSGAFSEPNLKPDWNHRLLLCQNYVCHLVLAERSLAREVGPLDSALDGAQDHDFLLRAAERLDPGLIHHVPELLYHWRKTPASTAGSSGAKGYTVRAGVMAVAGHLKRRGLKAHVSALNGFTMYRVDWKFAEQPSVRVIVPFKDQVETTRRCLQNLLANTDYKNFRVVLVDNWSQTPQARRFCAEAARDPRVEVLRIEERFNFSRLNNLAARAHPADFYLFLNNDVFVGRRDWLKALVDEALADPAVALVGAKLLYPNGTVQHAGVVLGVGGVADHAFKGLQAHDPGYLGRAACAQELSAVTAACMLCRADAFHDLGGFDEAGLAVAFNDVDLCLKARAAGHKVVYTPAALAEHHESLSRGDDMAPEKLARFFGENRLMEERWGAVLADDPFYNPHFSRSEGIFRDLRDPPCPAARPRPVRDPLAEPAHRLTPPSRESAGERRA